MTSELSQVLLVVATISFACMVLSPILWWILPNRATNHA